MPSCKAGPAAWKDSSLPLLRPRSVSVLGGCQISRRGREEVTLKSSTVVTGSTRHPLMLLINLTFTLPYNGESFRLVADFNGSGLTWASIRSLEE